jgi:hypothetical protein
MTTSAFLPPDIAPAEARAPDIVLTLPGDTPSERELRVVRIGHASVLLQWGDDTLLTDPWFSQQGAIPGYYSGESLAMGVNELPDLTGVLGSMNHWDHFDMQHFAAYRDRAVPVIVPAGTKQRDQAVAAGFTDVRALAPWGTVKLGAFTVMAVCTKPAQPPTSFEYEHAYVVEVYSAFKGHCPSASMSDNIQSVNFPPHARPCASRAWSFSAFPSRSTSRRDAPRLRRAPLASSRESAFQ